MDFFCTDKNATQVSSEYNGIREAYGEILLTYLTSFISLEFDFKEYSNASHSANKYEL